MSEERQVMKIYDDQDGSGWAGLLAMAAALAIAASACTGGDTASCEDDGDCFRDESCRQGYCEVVDEDNDDNQDNQHNQDNQDNGGDADDCGQDTSCDRVVDDAVADSYGMRITPDEYYGYGCPDEIEDSDFVATDEPLVFDARVCEGDDTHTYRLRTVSCSEHDFVVHYALEPRDEVCSVATLSDVDIWISTVGPRECDDEHTTFCYVVNETPDSSQEGRYSWTIIMDNVSSMETMSHDIRLIVRPDEGVSFPYRASVDVEKR